MVLWGSNLVIYSTFLAAIAVPIPEHELMSSTNIPHTPKYPGYFKSEEDQKKVAHQLEKWNPENGNFIWELSGLQEADIMMDESDEKNAALNVSIRWPNAVVPYHINEEDFSPERPETSDRRPSSMSPVLHQSWCVVEQVLRKCWRSPLEYPYGLDISHVAMPCRSCGSVGKFHTDPSLILHRSWCVAVQVLKDCQTSLGS
ncbi:hypothetical protein QAD02_012357 [Eretmocerus hayati]|uniref:Uncharacterized protein n=1 Tax=Eretmocerus hayati TaxID=131215 RepID=A0ACC2NZ85_9HYME|nr:hypothetical protein QAD02_012357 [Eretmocerus hayati]